MSPWLHSPLKRAIDLGLAGAGLLIVSPLLALLAVAVRVELGTPVLFRQERAGLGGRPFEIVKFRTMIDATGPDGEALPDADRLPPFGRLLRASSLDELPQLWSVVRGHMSLVGPRPLPMKYNDRYSAEQRRRLLATPGVTGWAQIQGRNAIDWPTKLAHDAWYVDHASPRVDLEIVVRTIRAVLASRDTTAQGHVSMPEFLGASGEAETGR